MKWRFWQISIGWQLQCQHVGIGVWNKALLSGQKLEWGGFHLKGWSVITHRTGPRLAVWTASLASQLEGGLWHEAAKCNVIKKRRRGKKAKGRTMNLVAWCHHYETLAWYHNDEVIAKRCVSLWVWHTLSLASARCDGVLMRMDGVPRAAHVSVWARAHMFTLL